jgi:hypothetical protein
VRGRAADLERLGREGNLAGAKAMLDELDAAVAHLIAELKTVHGE